MFDSLKINNKFSIYRHQKIVLADLSARLVGIAEKLGDSPFGVIRRRLALAFCMVVLCVIGRDSTASHNYSRNADRSFHRLFDPATSGLRVLEQRAEYVLSVNHQV
uniref:Uncharacterized protein n=1 Tax=Solanum tuberosum TaxID=4113 RepID=M1DMT6_SOLTU